MPNGLLFVWVEKECMQEVLNKMTREGFTYVEYLLWVKLDPAKEMSKILRAIVVLKKMNVEDIRDFEDLIWKEYYAGFSKVESCLLIFRRVDFLLLIM